MALENCASVTLSPLSAAEATIVVFFVYPELLSPEEAEGAVVAGGAVVSVGSVTSRISYLPAPSSWKVSFPPLSVESTFFPPQYTSAAE